MNILKILTGKRIVGNIGEDAACSYLKKQKYKIKGRNYVAAGHEIDIIAENREYVAFVEVKTRTAGHESIKESRPAASVTPEKQRSIISAARSYAASLNTNKKYRFDVAEVIISEEKEVLDINYIESAFTLTDAYAKHPHR
ncbi:MAG: YraN family protein [Ruminococcaceae bacterium]|nr:YraN family protein [Oscillospiraceae bacterium]